MPSTNPSPTIDDHVREIGTLIEAIRQLHVELSDRPLGDRAREADLLDLLRRRDASLRELGEAVYAFSTTTGRVPYPPEPPVPVVADPVPAPVVAPVPEPEPPAAVAAAPEAAVEAPPQPILAPPVAREPDRSPPAEPSRASVDPAPIRAPRVPTGKTPAPAPNRSPAPAPPRPSRPRPTDLRGHLEFVGKPLAVTDTDAAVELVGRLAAAAADLDAWLTFPTETQRALIGLVSSLARHLQDEVDLLVGAPADTLRGLFPTLTHWSKLYQPGFVPGLSRRFGPESSSWIGDAERWWAVLSTTGRPGGSPDPIRALPARTPSPAPRVEDIDPVEALRDLDRAVADPASDLSAALQRVVDSGVPQRDQRLVRCLLPHIARVSEVRGFKTLKSALKEAGAPDDDVDDEVDDARGTVVPEDWPYFAFTVGKRAVIVGGDPRQSAADRIREAFRFATVGWEVKDARRLQGLSERVRGGSTDVVILLRAFIGHSEQGTILEACRSADVPFVVVDTGYGVNQVRRAIERFADVGAAG